MAQVLISADVRTEFKKSYTRTLRKEGNIPATVYGKHVEAPISISITWEDLKRCVTTDAGINAIIQLTVADKTLPVMVKSIVREPRTHKILSVDFHTVAMDVKVHATVPVHITGEAIGVKVEGGQLEHIHRELTVLSLPGNVPDSFTLDVSNLHVADSIKIGDINVEGVEIEGPADDPIVLVRGKTAAAEKQEAEDAAAAEAKAERQAE